jgi:hypothetical protein
MMESSWITLYDVSRDGLGLAPWLPAAVWLAGICAGATAVKKSPSGRTFISLWLVAWTVMGSIGFGNVFYQYAANLHALKSGSCTIAEGPITNFQPQVQANKEEEFVAGGQHFGYSMSNLGSGGLRSSAGFSVPLRDGVYVKIWHRNGIICRLDARQVTGRH